MKIHLVALLVAGLGATAVAGPDFVAAHPPRPVAPGLAASDGTAPIAPLDVVAFANGSAWLLPSAIAQIDTAAKWLRSHPGYRIVVQGHTDLVGSSEYNEDLATRRANAVRNHLMAWGIPSDRIVLLVYGESDAIDPDTITDRRVVLYASTLPVRTIVTASLDKTHALTAVWTDRGSLLQEQKGIGAEKPRETVVSR